MIPNSKSATRTTTAISGTLFWNFWRGLGVTLFLCLPLRAVWLCQLLMEILTQNPNLKSLSVRANCGVHVAASASSREVEEYLFSTQRIFPELGLLETQ